MAAVDENSTAVALGLQLLMSAALVLVMTVLHAVGLIGIGRALHLEPEALRKRHIDTRAIFLMASLGLLLFALHIVEIVLFALFYLAAGVIASIEGALFFSASAYTTLGLTQTFPDEWRLIGACEALIGFVLIGWSTAFVIGTMERLRTDA